MPEPIRSRKQAEAPAVDRDQLLAFLADREGSTRSPLVQATYAGLADRIRRGDFDRAILSVDERATIVDALRDVPEIDVLMAAYRPSRQQEIDERLALANRIERGT